MTGEARLCRPCEAADDFFNAVKLVLLEDVRGEDDVRGGGPVNAQKLDFVWRRKLILLVDVSPQRADFCAPHGGPSFSTSVHFTRVVARFLQVLIVRGLADSRGFALFCSPLF